MKSISLLLIPALVMTSCALIQSGSVSKTVSISGCTVKADYVLSTDGTGKQTSVLVLTALTECNIPITLNSQYFPDFKVTLTKDKPVVIPVPTDLTNLKIEDLLNILQVIAF